MKSIADRFAIYDPLDRVGNLRCGCREAPFARPAATAQVQPDRRNCKEAVSGRALTLVLRFCKTLGVA
jgi:hypothetical protein